MVIHRTEINKAVHTLARRIEALEQGLLAQEAEEDHMRPQVRHEIMVEVMTVVRQVVLDLPERLDLLEQCLAEIEGRLKLRRKPQLRALPAPMEEAPREEAS